MQFALLARRRFLPLFLTQFFGALNDNLFKQAMVILIAYRLAEAAGLDGQILVTLAAGLFILPFFLFSATAGKLADRFEKTVLIRLVKTAEILFMAIAAAGFLTGSVALLFAVLFLMGVHSTFFGPIKYSILPVHLGADELLAGNALIEASTYLAILAGTIAGGLLVTAPGGPEIISVGVLAVAALGLASACFVPLAPPAAPGLRLSVNILADTAETMGYARRQRRVFGAILGISWFWLVGATFLSQFPTFAKAVLGADESVVTLFLVAFTVGIGIGSLLCNRLLHGKASTRLVPYAGIGISLFALDLYLASPAAPPGNGRLAGAAALLATLAGWRLTLDLVLIAVCGGLFIVPLYVVLQTAGEPSHRSRIIAANNIWNALFMVVAALATMGLLALHVTVPQVFLAVAAANLAVALATWFF